MTILVDQLVRLFQEEMGDYLAFPEWVAWAEKEAALIEIDGLDGIRNGAGLLQ